MASPPDGSVHTPAAVRPPEYPEGSLFERVLDLIFPPTCAGCGKVGRWICQECWPAIGWLAQRQCRGCGRVWLGRSCVHCLGGDSSLESLDALTRFGGTAREAVHALKFGGQHAIATPMARMLAQRASAGLTLVAPVPLHPARRRERGYDQCVMLAQRTAKFLDLPCEPGTLRRVRRTKQQAMLTDAEARMRNVEGAFEARLDVEDDVILLIDDVTTSGATIESAARPLLEHGAFAIHGLVFSSARDFTVQDA